MMDFDFAFAFEGAGGPGGPWGSFQVVNFRGHEEISALSRYELTLLAKGPSPEVDPFELVGKRATLRLKTLTAPDFCVVHGIIAEAEATLGAIDAAYGGAVGSYVASGRDRYFPSLDAVGWQRLVLAAALRAYIEAVDPHGQWAPLDEEWSLYAGDPSFYDPDRLWGDTVRTALGVRVVDAPVAPLEVDDLVLEVDGVATTGLSFEQIEQLSRVSGAVDPNAEPRQLVILRQGDRSLSSLEIAPPSLDEFASDDEAIGEDELDVLEEAVALGQTRTVVVDARVDAKEQCFPMIPAGAAALDLIEFEEERVVEAGS